MLVATNCFFFIQAAINVVKIEDTPNPICIDRKKCLNGSFSKLFNPVKVVENVDSMINHHDIKLSFDFNWKKKKLLMT